jgi:hypothetical protein
VPALQTNNQKFFSASPRDVHECTNVAGVRIHKSDLCGEIIFLTYTLKNTIPQKTFGMTENVT